MKQLIKLAMLLTMFKPSLRHHKFVIMLLLLYLFHFIFIKKNASTRYLSKPTRSQHTKSAVPSYAHLMHATVTVQTTKVKLQIQNSNSYYMKKIFKSVPFSYYFCVKCHKRNNFNVFCS